MHGSSEGVLVQEMGCKKVVEIGRGGRRGVVRGIYRAYRCIYYRGLLGYIIYSCMYSVYWWGDQSGGVIYIGCAMYRSVSYSRYIGLVSILHPIYFRGHASYWLYICEVERDSIALGADERDTPGCAQ